MNPYDEPPLTFSQLLRDKLFTIVLIAAFFGPLVFFYLWCKLK